MAVVLVGFSGSLWIPHEDVKALLHGSPWRMVNKCLGGCVSVHDYHDFPLPFLNPCRFRKVKRGTTNQIPNPSRIVIYKFHINTRFFFLGVSVLDHLKLQAQEALSEKEAKPLAPGRGQNRGCYHYNETVNSVRWWFDWFLTIKHSDFSPSTNGQPIGF